MSWNNCRKCIFLPRANFTSAIFKVLLTLKLLHGSRGGAKGSTLEDIAMHMMKYYPLDGDIKSQVLASLKYGVKMHFIQKKKEKFALILPASSVQLAPCKFKEEEFERITCIFPPVWQSNACNDAVCGHGADQSCCGKRKRALPSVCCHGSEDEDDEGQSDTCGTCAPCKAKRSKSSCRSGRSRTSGAGGSCNICNPPAKKSKWPCPAPKPPICHRKHGKRTRAKNALDGDYCHLCENDPPEDMKCNPAYKFEAYKNCSCCNK